ncbi:ATP-binding cassette domain-containing protein [Desulfobulbus sp. US4]|nr:ATP-binding cassette domain-containing protein [Desulfobulbus sp. US4]
MQLACDNLSFQYPDNGTSVLDHLSFTIQGPGFHAVFGPSGAGKTSLARIISSGITGYKGSLRLKKIRTILYTYNMERLPGWSNIGSLLQQVTPSGRESLLEELITVFDLNDLMHSRFAQLSMGQQNRVNLIREGEAVYFFNPSAFGVNFVANSIITSKKMVQEQPLVVEKFLTALLQGWEAAMNQDNETEVLAAVKELDKNTADKIMKKQLASTRKLVLAEAKKIGAIDVLAWQQTEAIMLQAGQIKRAVQVEKYLRVR